MFFKNQNKFIAYIVIYNFIKGLVFLTKKLPSKSVTLFLNISNFIFSDIYKKYYDSDNCKTIL